MRKLSTKLFSHDKHADLQTLIYQILSGMYTSGMNAFSNIYPGLAEWLGGSGWIEIGSDENSSSLLRLLDEGGLIWESPSNVRDVDEALKQSENVIAKWIKENQ